MSLELVLLPLRGPEEIGKRTAHCYERLRFDQDYRIFGQLTNLSSYREDERSDIPAKPTIKVNPLPPQMWAETYEDEGTKRTREDPYGEELTFVYAQQLKKLRLPSNASLKNKAIKAFVDALPDNIPIILDWR